MDKINSASRFFNLGLFSIHIKNTAIKHLRNLTGLYIIEKSIHHQKRCFHTQKNNNSLKKTKFSPLQRTNHY